MVTRRPFMRRNRKYGVRTRKATRTRISRIGSYSKYMKAARTLNSLANRIPRGVSTPFPQTKITRHKYVDNIVMPAGSGAGQLSVYIFRAASTFDPDLTGVGHQPMFRDEMAAKYQYYTVIASFIKVTWDPTDSEFMNRGIALTEDQTHPIDPTTFGEIFPLRTPQVPSQQNNALVSRSSFNAGKYYKTTQKAIMADEDKRTSAGNNPAFGPVFNLYRAPVRATDTLGTSTCQVEIVYVTAWRELNSYTQS